MIISLSIIVILVVVAITMVTIIMMMISAVSEYGIVKESILNKSK